MTNPTRIHQSGDWEFACRMSKINDHNHILNNGEKWSFNGRIIRYSLQRLFPSMG